MMTTAERPRATNGGVGHGRRLLSRGILVSISIAATIVLFLVSRGKWSDAIVDSGREWIVPDALARGEVLYRDVVYWFGPLTPYAHAALFRIFGSSFGTLVLAGVVGSIGVALALHAALRRFTGNSEALLWTALAVAALVFMPNAGGAILGMGFRMWHAAAFSLLAVAFAARPSFARPTASGIAAGVLCAFAGLCRTEWGLAVLVASLTAVAVRGGVGRRFAREGGLLAISAGVTFSLPFLLLAVTAGPSSFLSDAPVLLVGIPDITRRNVLRGGSGVGSGLSALLYSSAMWLGAFIVVEVVALHRRDPGRLRRRAPFFLAVVVVLALTAATGGTSGATLFCAAPLICAASIVVGVSGRPRPAAGALAGFGLAGLLVSHRRFFHLTDAPYVGPPLLFAVACAALLLWRAVASESRRAPRERLRSALHGAVAVLALLVFAGRFVEYRADDRVPVAGTDGMLSAHADVARDIVEIASAVRDGTRDGDGLVVFPEGEVLNYLSGRRNPIRHKLYLPGYVNDRNEAEIIRELERAKPTAVVIWNRGTGEYGPAGFGDGYGGALRSFISENYAPRPYRPASGGRPHALLAFRVQR